MTAIVSQKAVLFAESEVLVVREPDGTWELPGGRIDQGETPLEALHRELAEETGLDADIGQPVYTAVKRRTSRRAKFFVYYRGWVDDRAVSLSEEHDAYEWLAPDAAAERVSDRCAMALSRATATR